MATAAVLTRRNSQIVSGDTPSEPSSLSLLSASGSTPPTWAEWAKRMTVYEPAVSTLYFLPLHLQQAHRFLRGAGWSEPITGAATVTPLSSRLPVHSTLAMNHDAVHGHYEFQWCIDPRKRHAHVPPIVLAGDQDVPEPLRAFLMALKYAQPGSVKSVSIQFAGFQWDAGFGSSSSSTSTESENEDRKEQYLEELAEMDAHSPEYAMRCKAMDGTLFDESRGECGSSMYRVLPTLLHSALAPHVPHLEQLHLMLVGAPHSSRCYNRKLNGHRILSETRFARMVSAVRHDLNLLRLLCKPMLQQRPCVPTDNHALPHIEFVYAIISPYNLRFLESPCHTPVWASSTTTGDEMSSLVLQNV